MMPFGLGVRNGRGRNGHFFAIFFQSLFSVQAGQSIDQPACWCLREQWRLADEQHTQIYQADVLFRFMTAL